MKAHIIERDNQLFIVHNIVNSEGRIEFQVHDWFDFYDFPKERRITMWMDSKLCKEIKNHNFIKCPQCGGSGEYFSEMMARYDNYGVKCGRCGGKGFVEGGIDNVF